jgi:hypothetical protein
MIAHATSTISGPTDDWLGAAVSMMSKLMNQLHPAWSDLTHAERSTCKLFYVFFWQMKKML